ncbi:MAG: M1 family metallopeptidase [Blastocatellia bacterium]
MMTYGQEEGVSRELARQRAAVLSEVRYALRLAIVPGAARLKGSEEIRFRLAKAGADLVLDFRDLDAGGNVIDGAISNIAVNGQPAEDARRVNGHLVLPARRFHEGENAIALEFETGAAPAGRPLIRYKDADDGSEYLYTLFVPMDASLAFPCFDQPDLKGRFTFEATAPADWVVAANTREQRVDRQGAVSVWRFSETQPISTYLFAFAAGPFKIIEDAEASAPPGRFLVRSSKFERAKQELPEVAALTRAGMKHFSAFFGHPFPFLKYDQVLLPGFAYGGMEHAGATFLREDAILFRMTPTRADKLGRASLVLHELAHQWFGDLVTMRWFDDLWLKEGFANFMAYHALAAINDPAEMWKRFYQSHKPVAYGIDSTPGTTPIYQEVRNLRDAKSAYGAIVYQKAPSLLHALSFLIGEEKFRDGVRLFLKEHAYANAEWSDLIGAFERSSRQPLTVWANAWVRRRGMPQIDVEWSCDGGGRIARFELRQHDAQNEGRVWPIKTRVLLAYDDAEPVRLTARLQGALLAVPQAVGKACPAYVFANDGDFGYGRFMLDARSREAVLQRIGGIRDPFLRTMLWGALWDAVREAQLSPSDYLAAALRSLPAEADEELAQSILDRAARAYQRYLSEPQREMFAPRLESVCADRMMNAGETGMRITYFRAFRAVATTAEGRSKLRAMLAGSLAVPGVEIKPLDRWRLLTALLSLRDPEAESLLDAERKRDAGDDGRKQAYIAEAARADAATKQRYFEEYTKNRAIPEDWIEGSLGAFNSISHPALTLPYLRPALDALPQVKRERKIFFVLAWLNAFLGGQRSPEALAEVRGFLKRARIDRDLELKVLEVADELERTVRIREKFSN